MSSVLSIQHKNNHSEAPATRRLGRLGEALAVEHLVENGYRIVIKNFQVPIGRNRQEATITGEIDLVAIDGETLCFIEVKTRSSQDFAPIAAAVDAAKQRKIIRTAKVYRRLFGIRDCPFRYDVVTVFVPPEGAPELTLLKGYWSEAKFRKRTWSVEFWNDVE
jgi:putative endonuclease